MEQGSDTAIDATVDTSGLMCPEPVMMLHQAIKKANSGDCIFVIATDPSTTRDIPKFCMHLGHNLLKQTTTNDVYNYWVEKK